MKEENQDKCTLCGMCKIKCPIFKVLKSEAHSPRGKEILKEKEVYDKIFYKCTLCGACKEECPLKLDLGLKPYRQKLVEKRVKTPANKKMIINIRKHGNPFGKVDGDKDPDDLYCC